MHIAISEFVFPLCCRYQIVLYFATSPYSNPTTYTSCEPPRNIRFSTASHLTIIKKKSTNQSHDITVLGWLFILSLLRQWPEQWLCCQPGQLFRLGKYHEQQNKNLYHSDYKYCRMTSLLVCFYLYSYTKQITLSHISICAFHPHKWLGILA